MNKYKWIREEDETREEIQAGEGEREEQKPVSKWKKGEIEKEQKAYKKWVEDKPQRDEIADGLDMNPNYTPRKFSSDTSIFSNGTENMPREEQEAAEKIKSMWDSLSPEQQKYFMKKDPEALKKILGLPDMDYAPTKYKGSPMETPHNVYHPEAQKAFKGHASGNPNADRS